MPGLNRLSQSSPAAKKQKSISSFFSPKPTPSQSNPPSFQSKSRAAPQLDDSPEVESHATPQLDDTSEERHGDGLFVSDSDSGSKRAREDAAQDKDGVTDEPRRSTKRVRIQSESPTHHLPILPRAESVKTNAANTSRPRPPSSSNGSPQLSTRTSKYLFASSSQPEGEVPVVIETEQASVISAREELHRRFVKKLGRPDSIAEIKRRNRFVAEETADAEDGELAEDEEEGRATTSKDGRKGTAGKKATSKLTPMEKQILEIKTTHMDTILVVEVGYKFRFFGEDARTAAKELSIVCIPGKFRYDEHPSEAHIDRFASASIPVHRLHVHVKRLVAAGHKVGVVRQLETAALKAAGDNRNAPFVRKLTNVYTKGTYIDDVDGLESSTDGPSGGAPASGYLLCITETNAKGWGTDEKVQVGIVAVQPATGDVIYDDFEDGFMRSEIETRLLHIAPCELVIVGELSKATEKLLHHLSGSTTVFGEKIRIERMEKSKTASAQSYNHIATFYAEKLKGAKTADETASNLLERVLKLSDQVTICLSGMITHMTEYGLEHVFDLTKYFQSFSARSHMLLNGNTLTSLEIYRNQTDHAERGSLFWTLDRTQTRFGQRLLRKWVGRPLLDKSKLEQRVAAVEELKRGEGTTMVEKVTGLLGKVKTDLEKSLIRVYYGKCTRPELLTVLQTMQRIANEFAFVQSQGDVFQSAQLNTAVAALPVIAEAVERFLDKINPEAAKQDDKYSFFRDEDETEEIEEQKLGIASVEHELDGHRALAAEKIRKKKVDYVTVAGIEYLIEVDNAQLRNVPASWAKISGTKRVSRFHTPEVVRLTRERDQHKEALAAACDVAFAQLLTEIAAEYSSFRDCIQALATLDCLLSLATVASQTGYVKPEYTIDASISVERGRHPMVEQLLLESYVPNSIELDSDGTRALLITGPNMGGKSSYVRQVALIAIMGQIGSYVPAASARLGMLDAVFTRMGAFDNMMAGESTFMVELSETSDILKQATPRSLVILDELGRGTSTHDGVAIAHAVLEYVVRQIRCLTLFITHYQSLSSVSRGFDRGVLKNVHMRFRETETGTGGGRGDEGGGKEITFLYEVDEGVAHRSYGLNVARLAAIPDGVLEVAKIKSRELEERIRERKLGCLSRMLVQDSLSNGAFTQGGAGGGRRRDADADVDMNAGTEEEEREGEGEGEEEGEEEEERLKRIIGSIEQL